MLHEASCCLGNLELSPYLQGTASNTAGRCLSLLCWSYMHGTTVGISVVLEHCSVTYPRHCSLIQSNTSVTSLCRYKCILVCACQVGLKVGMELLTTADRCSILEYEDLDRISLQAGPWWAQPAGLATCYVSVEMFFACKMKRLYPTSVTMNGPGGCFCVLSTGYQFSSVHELFQHCNGPNPPSNDGRHTLAQPLCVFLIRARALFSRRGIQSV